MMKYIKRIVLILIAIVCIVVLFNYRKLNIIAGYAAKNVASSVFLANRSLSFTNNTDTKTPPIHIATTTVNASKKTSSSSVFNLLTRKAIYREGVGSVLITNDEDINTPYLVPKRSQVTNNLAFPYGNKDPKDSLFSNINYTQLQQTIDTMFAKKNQTRAVLVLHKNKIIAEQYAAGFDKDSRLLGWSMTKSILSTLYGILQYQGTLNVTDRAPIAAWQNDNRKEITLNNLLQMRSGLAWEEDYTTICDVTKMLFLEKDMSLSQINKPLIAEPNTITNYSSGTSNLLSGLLRNYFTTQQAYLDFWYTDLIDKIGMHSMTIETDLMGNYVASSYGWATARDWSKLGLLYLNKGDWNGTRIFDENWVSYATNAGTNLGEENTKLNASDSYSGEYGAHLWLNLSKTYADVPKSLYSFNGHQGQYVFILPEQDLVIVRLGLTKNADLNAFLSGIIKAVNY